MQLLSGVPNHLGGAGTMPAPPTSAAPHRHIGRPQPGPNTAHTTTRSTTPVSPQSRQAVDLPRKHLTVLATDRLGKVTASIDGFTFVMSASTVHTWDSRLKASAEMTSLGRVLACSEPRHGYQSIQ